MKKGFFSAAVSLLLCITLMMTAMVFRISAADTASVSLSSTTAKAGDTVTVTVNLNNNPGIIALGLDVGYDTSKLQLTGVSDKGVLAGWAGSSNYSSTKTNNLQMKDETPVGSEDTVHASMPDAFGTVYVWSRPLN